MASAERQVTIPHPELIQGSSFRHSIIIPQREGRFELTGLAIPRGWQKAGKLLGDSSKTEEFLRRLLEENHLEDQCRVTVDEETGLLARVNVGTVPTSFLQLSGLPGGEYQSSFFDLRTAIAVQYFASVCLNEILHALGDERLFSYIAGGPNHYGPVDLEIPRPFRGMNLVEPVTTPEYQQVFTQEASNLTRQFGLSLVGCTFDNVGRLKYYEVKPGDNNTYYCLDRSSRFYGEHNVDTPEQAVALQAVGTTFVNYLWEKLEVSSANG